LNQRADSAPVAISCDSVNRALQLARPDVDVLLRPSLDADIDFCAMLYATTRAAEMAMVPWSDADKAKFCRQQFQAQRDHYRNHFPAAEYLVITSRSAPHERMGRVYFHVCDDELSLMEITLLPSLRGQGIGTAIVRTLLGQAQASGMRMTLHVETTNPAKRLYERLGFRDVEEQGFYMFMRTGDTSTG
jgi:ribosomal protein S18 acetylase RimI-like enzyme